MNVNEESKLRIVTHILIDIIYFFINKKLAYKCQKNQRMKKNNCGKLKKLLINVIIKKIMNYNILSSGRAGMNLIIHGNQYLV